MSTDLPLAILRYPDPRLHEVSVPVEASEINTPQFQKLIDDMFATMYQVRGIGLAAPQVNVRKRFMVIDVSPDRNAPHVFINPVITHSSGQTPYKEGCLSVPGVFEVVNRPSDIVVKYLDRHGKANKLSTSGLLATCIQHEIDHLDGVLYIQRVSSRRQTTLMRRLKNATKALA